MQLLKALIVQILSSLLTWVLYITLSEKYIDFRFFPVFQSIIAMLLSKAFHQPVWWRLIHLLFMPTVVGMMVFQISPWLYFSALLCSVLIFWGTVKGDAPLFLSSPAVVNVLQEIIKTERAAEFADIGAGIGTIVAPLAGQFPNLVISAWERAPLPWLLACMRCRNLSNVEVKFASFWQANLADYAVVFAFLSPVVMVSVGKKSSLK